MKRRTNVYLSMRERNYGWDRIETGGVKRTRKRMSHRDNRGLRGYEEERNVKGKLQPADTIPLPENLNGKINDKLKAFAMQPNRPKAAIRSYPSLSVVSLSLKRVRMKIADPFFRTLNKTTIIPYKITK